MHIAMAYHYFWPHRGGIESAVGGLARELVKTGHSVTFVTSNIGENRVDMRPRHERIAGIDVLRLPKLWLPARALALRGLPLALRELEPDIWHPQHPSPFVADRTVSYAKSAGVPCVLSYHADAADEKAMDKALASGYYRLLGNRMLGSADAIIAHSRSYASSSPWLKHHLKKTTIIPLGIDPAELKGADGSIVRKRFGLDGRRVVCSVGRMVPYKGYEYLIRALEHLDADWTLLLGGTGPEERRLHALAKELMLENRVVFAGWVADRDKKHFYAAGDVFAMSSISRGEAFGVSALEALAVGTPTIITDIPGPRDIKGAIKVPPRDPRALAAAIERASGKRAKLDSVYHISNVAKQTLKVYEKFL